MKTIEVIPRRYLIHPGTGRTCSAHGAWPPGYVPRTAGFTWRLTDHRGGVTIGLGRTPAPTYPEAVLVAQRFAARTGYHLLTTERNS